MLTIHKTEPSVLLASMPWAKLAEPSLGLAILKACLSKEQIKCKTAHLNLLLLNHLKPSTYIQVADLNGINDFVFSGVLEKDVQADQLMVLENLIQDLMAYENNWSKRFKTSGEYFNFFLQLRNQVIPTYLKECANEVFSQPYTMLGLTCLFDQTIASVALAKIVKEKRKDILIALGGYALEGDCGHEIIRSFDFIDVVAYGDGEPVIACLAKASTGEKSLAEIPNIHYRTDLNSGVQRSLRTIKINLEESPNPDYKDYFEDIIQLEQKSQISIKAKVLPVETSRGCWWGQKSHCIFCGIDEETLKYRQKSPEQVFKMFDYMVERYPATSFRIVDYILPHTYYKTVLPELAKRQPILRLSCEMKSNITYEKFKQMKDSGFIEVQPGIESFSTPILKKMKKGVSGIQNVLTLKLGKELGIKVDWNLLYDFPGDTYEQYLELLGIIPCLYHFDPPFNHSGVFVTKFAPLHTEFKSFGIKAPVYNPLYNVIFSEAFVNDRKFNFNHYGYFYNKSWETDTSLPELFQLLDIQVSYWKNIHSTNNAYFYYETEGDEIVFFDNRLARTSPFVYRFSSLHRDIYLELHKKILNKVQLLEAGHVKDENELDSVLNDLLSKRIIYHEDHQYVGLALSGVRLYGKLLE